MAPAKAALAFCLLYTTAAVYSASDVLEIEEGNELGLHIFRISFLFVLYWKTFH